MTARARAIGITLAALAAVALGVCAAWPIYERWWLLVPATVGLVFGAGVAFVCAWRLRIVWSLAVLFAVFVVTVVPVAVPQAFDRLPEGLALGLLDGVAAVALGWKQLLTLTLPVGTYQTVMVPAYLVFLVSTFAAVTIAVRAGRFAPFAAIPLAAPVAFGTIFGASEVSDALRLGPLQVAAPRELGLWALAVLVGAIWVWFSAGAERRAALRRGRQVGETARGGGRVTRFAIGGATLVVALIAGVALAPMLDDGNREVPRDRLDPEVVLRERASPLAAYRAWKRDDRLDATLFTIDPGDAGGSLPGRLRLVALDRYNGVDFSIGDDAAGRFTRFPSAQRPPVASTVSITIGEGYSDIWVPMAELGSVPVFSGPRALDLADAFYVNRESQTAIAVPGGEASEGLVAGDGFTATLSIAAAPELSDPSGDGPSIDLDSMPELGTWLEAQDQPATAAGLIELVQRLRDRGYLSHSISNAEGQQLWLERLSSRYGTRFESSPGGHSLARIEQLFAQLNTQERLAGDDPRPEMLVAAIGDDEQFGAAVALIARALGFESRVVMGVRLGGEAQSVDGVPACEATCTGEHVAAWVEVRGAQTEWVAIDVTPQVTLRPSTLEEGEQLPEFSTVPEERDAREVDPPIGLGENSDGAEPGEEEVAGGLLWRVLRVLGLSLSALLLLLLPFLFLPLAKRARARKRRRERDPELRALGAWNEMVDRGADAGLPILVDASRSETARVLDTDAAKWAAVTADRAVFSAEGVSDQEADWMWHATETDSAERWAALSPWRRWRSRYSLRSYGVGVVRRRARAEESASGVEPRKTSR